jgi:hypothetical protein
MACALRKGASSDSFIVETFMHRNVEIRYTPRKFRTEPTGVMSFQGVSRHAMQTNEVAPPTGKMAGRPTGSKTLFFLFVATLSAVFVLFVCWQLVRWL